MARKVRTSLGPTPAVQVRAHAPERRRSLVPGPSTLAHGCSTCCCCLHTVGSLAGAALMSWGTTGPASKARRAYWIHLLFWTSVVLLAMLATMGSVNEVLLFLAIGFPAGQLVASATAAVQLLGMPSGERRAALGRLGWITLGSVAGGFAGGVLVWTIFRMM
jgi:lysylphosphatidylglycerol synthetase-like protein (DUF2156 family)